jgi:hypothetical protein
MLWNDKIIKNKCMWLSAVAELRLNLHRIKNDTEVQQQRE